MATLYDTLGVHAHATEDEIKRAYRKAAMKWHPDRNSGAEEVARATFQEIKDAYAILSDAEQRKVYDSVYAEQMRQWESVHARHQKAQAEHERQRAPRTKRRMRRWSRSPCVSPMKATIATCCSVCSSAVSAKRAAPRRLPTAIGFAGFMSRSGGEG